MSGKKRRVQEGESEETDYVAKPPKILSNMHLRNQEKRLIIILERAQLESAKVTTVCHEEEFYFVKIYCIVGQQRF